MRRRGLASLIGIVVVTLVLFVGTFVIGNEPLLGLDLQGGVSVVLQPTEPADEGQLDQAIDIIRRRIDSLGVAEPEITRQGDTILVQIPGVDDQERALELVGQTAELRFRPVLSVSAEGIDPSELPTTTTAPPGTTVPGEGGATTTAPPAGDGTTVAPADTTAPSDAAPEGGEGDGGDEQGLGALAPGENAGGATEAAQPTIPPQTDSTVPPDDPSTVPPLTSFDPSTFQITPPEQDEADQTVVLPGEGEEGSRPLYQLGPAALTGEALEGAVASLTPGTGQWVVLPTFKAGADGIDLFNDIAAKCYAQDPTCPTGMLAITLDGEVISAPTIQTPSFSRDQVQISGNFTEGEAKDLALVLRYGALPVELEPQQTQVVSATLGEDALRAGIIAGLIGAVAVALYMIVFYRLLGLTAIGSLAISMMLLWTLIAYLGDTQGLALTLAGVTGIIVSVGVAVDSNIVYYETIKEGVREGRTLRSSAERSFQGAFSTIVKADSASLIGAVILYVLTVGPVRGFALMLGLATLLDLIASWFFMRPLTILLARSKAVERRPGLFGIRRERVAPVTGAGRTSKAAAGAGAQP